MDREIARAVSVAQEKADSNQDHIEIGEPINHKLLTGLGLIN